MKDGIYCDASVRSTPYAGIAVIKVEGGRGVERHLARIERCNSEDAELVAIAWARQIYPGLEVFSDCSSAAAKSGAIWIRREENDHADRASCAARRDKKCLILKNPLDRPLKPPSELIPRKNNRVSPHQRRKNHRRGGSGCYSYLISPNQTHRLERREIVACQQSKA